jgi:hypothetical protein
MNVLNDKNGKQSSKRIAGFIILGLGIGLLIALYFGSWFNDIVDPNTALSCANTLMYVGGGLLGLGIFEGIKIGGNK